MREVMSTVPPPPDVAERWLHDAGKRNRMGTLTGGLGQVHRGGSGGRWLLWLGRTVLWALVVVLLVNGLLAVRRPRPTMPAPVQEPVAGATFPIAGAEAFTVRFANDYLTWDAARPEARAEALAGYIADDMDQQLGWANNGSQIAVLVLPVRTEVISDRSAVVTVAAEVTGLEAPRWVHLAVPIYTDGKDRFLVTDPPALVPAPGEADPPPGQRSATDVDIEVTEQLREPLTAFFRAYAGSEPGEMAYVLAPGVEVGTLNGVVVFEDLALTVPKSSDERRDVVAEVRWSDPVTGSTFTQSYQVTVALRSDGRWYIERLGAHPAASPSPTQERP